MKKILAIDDQIDNLTTISAVLKNNMVDCTIITALSGKEGIELARTEQPDTILLDIIMPQMDGYEVCRILKNDKQMSHIPVILITAIKTDSESRAKGLNIGADAFLSKPIDVIELVAQVNVMLRIKEAEDKLRSEKKHLEEEVIRRTLKLKESEERFKMVAEAAGEWIWEVNRDGLFTYSSSSVEKILGYKPEEIVGKKHFYDFFQEEYREQLKESAFDVFNQKLVFNGFENPNMHKDGHIVIMNTSGSPVLDNAGNLIGYRGADSDITERKKTENDIIESKIFLQNVLNTTPSAVFAVDTDKCFTGWNKMAEKITGYTEVEVLGKSCELLLSTTCGDHCRLFDDSIKKPGEFKECNIFGKSGNEIETIKNFALLKNADGEIIGGIESFIDVSQLRKVEADLKENEVKFKQISQSAKDGIILINNDGKIIFWNRAAEKIFGYKQDEVIDMDLHSLITPENYREEANKMFKIFRETGEGNAIGQILQLEGLRKNDEIFPIELSLSALQLKGKWNAVGIVRDITERKEWEVQMIAAKEKAEESDRLKSIFLSTMSHELRTPLNAVIGFSSLIDKDLPIDDILEFNKNINQSGQQLLNIIESIFDISNIEAGITKLQPKEFDLNSMVHYLEEVAKTEKSKLDKGEIRIQVSLPKNIKNVKLNSDQNKIQQVLINLLVNALKFTDKGSIEFGYLIENDNDLKFFVKDTGIGISEDKKDFIFEKFRQIEEGHTREYGGIGLGLAISKKIVELLGGKIWIESKLGIGTSFYVTIPDIISQKEITESSQDKSRSKHDFSNKCILVVEDDTINYLFVYHLLKATGVKILWAQDGREAISKFNEHSEIDLTLMDLRIPIIDGFEVTKEIMSINSAAKIIVLSAHAGVQDKEKALKIGCIDFFSKPFNSRDLLDRMEDILN